MVSIVTYIVVSYILIALFLGFSFCWYIAGTGDTDDIVIAIIAIIFWPLTFTYIILCMFWKWVYLLFVKIRRGR